jgi:uncharacterized protein
MNTTRILPSPTPGADTQAFWEAADRGEFMLRYCNDCSRPHWYPRAICPLCGSADTQWQSASGKGTIFSCSVLRRTEKPYCLAYIELDEGPVILSNVTAPDLDTVRIGQRVTVTFADSENGQKVPVFTPT